MADIEEIQGLQQKVENLKTKRDTVQGSLDEALRNLKKEFGVTTLAEAKKLLVTMEEKEASKKDDFQKAFTAFKEKWGNALEGV